MVYKRQIFTNMKMPYCFEQSEYSHFRGWSVFHVERTIAKYSPYAVLRLSALGFHKSGHEIIRHFTDKTFASVSIPHPCELRTFTEHGLDFV